MSMVSARFPRELAEQVRLLARADQVSVSEWLRQTVQREVDGLAEIDVTIGPPFSGSGRFRVPAKLIREAAEAGLRNRASPARTFACAHWAIGGVVAGECTWCGPMQAAA